MDTQSLAKAVVEVKKEAEKSKKKFSQSIDLIIILKPRKSKSEEALDTLIYLPNKVREIKTCAFVDKDMSTQATGVFSKVVLKDDFAKYDKKSIRKLIKEYDYFFAEATIMAPTAAKFGKQLTALNKMPNPKTNTVITPASNLKAAVEKIQFATKVNTKKNNAILVKVGDQKTEDNSIINNVNAIYSTVRSSLSNGEAAIKHIYLKPTMGKSVAV
jgi:ribosomal protein L1